MYRIHSECITYLLLGRVLCLGQEFNFWTTSFVDVVLGEIILFRHFTYPLTSDLEKTSLISFVRFPFLFLFVLFTVACKWYSWSANYLIIFVSDPSCCMHMHIPSFLCDLHLMYLLCKWSVFFQCRTCLPCFWASLSVCEMNFLVFIHYMSIFCIYILLWPIPWV